MQIQSHKNIIVTCRYVAQTGYENSSELCETLITQPSASLYEIMDWAMKKTQGETLVSVSISLADSMLPLDTVSREIPVGPPPRRYHPNEKQITIEVAETPAS